MAINNLNQVHLTDEQINNISKALTTLEEAMKTLQVNLTPEDRNRYGRVNEQNKLFINKVKDFAEAEPNLKAPDVNWDEFMNDFKSRNALEKMINRLNALVIKANNSKTLHDFDNYQDALLDYGYTNYRAGSNAVGFERKYDELKQFFAKNKGTTNPTNSNLPLS